MINPHSPRGAAAPRPPRGAAAPRPLPPRAAPRARTCDTPRIAPRPPRVAAPPRKAAPPRMTAPPRMPPRAPRTAPRPPRIAPLAITGAAAPNRLPLARCQAHAAETRTGRALAAAPKRARDALWCGTRWRGSAGSATGRGNRQTHRCATAMLRLPADICCICEKRASSVNPPPPMPCVTDALAYRHRPAAIRSRGGQFVRHSTA